MKTVLPKPVKQIGWTEDGHTAIHYADGAEACLIPLEPGQVVTYQQANDESNPYERWLRELGPWWTLAANKLRASVP